MKFKFRNFFIISFALISIVVISGLAYLTYFSSSTKKVVVEITNGLGIKDIAQRLEESRVIKNGEVFIIYVLLKGVGNRLQAGEYEFRPGATISSVTRKLVSGDVVVRRLTIPEGVNVNEIGELLEKKRVVTKEEFLNRARSMEFAEELLGQSYRSFEGYLFPETYFYKKGITADELIRLMVKRYKEVWGSINKVRSESRLKEHEIVTLASIIEEETGVPEERRLISDVFHNRLRLGMRLESDPTVIYGLGSGFYGDLTKETLKNNSDYNTYTNFGLPPGPISNPGKASLEAALNPPELNYLYFVSKGNGTHEFSTNYSDHVNAVNIYQK